MKIKLSNAEMEAMTKVLDAIVINWQIDLKDADGLLYKCMFDYMDYEVKKQYLKNKPQYKLTLKPEWSLAFWVVVNPQLEQIKDAHVKNLLLTICNNIHKTYLS